MARSIDEGRRRTRTIHVGPVAIGGDAPVSVQGMTRTDTRDVGATLEQVRALEGAGCEIVRMAAPDDVAARALGEIVRGSPLPVIADIHFDHRLALAALAAGVAGLRINPGNIGGRERVAEVVAAARERLVPIRVGVNSGSLEREVRDRHGGVTAEAMVDSAMGHVRLLEDLGYEEIKISVKAPDVRRTVDAYRLLSRRTPYPLHLGVTEAGTWLAGTVRSSVAMGILLAEGIGDTLRVSLTEPPAEEVRVGLELLRSLDLRPRGASVISCPACGRAEVDVSAMAHAVEAVLDAYYRDEPDGPRPVVAVMGCVVNGPGEAREADVAVAGGRGRAALYTGGRCVGHVDPGDVPAAILERVRAWRAGKETAE